jgi:hypothetical protein
MGNMTETCPYYSELDHASGYFVELSAILKIYELFIL